MGEVAAYSAKPVFNPPAGCGSFAADSPVPACAASGRDNEGVANAAKETWFLERAKKRGREAPFSF